MPIKDRISPGQSIIFRTRSRAIMAAEIISIDYPNETVKIILDGDVLGNTPLQIDIERIVDVNERTFVPREEIIYVD